MNDLNAQEINVKVENLNLRKGCRVQSFLARLEAAGFSLLPGLLLKLLSAFSTSK